MDADDIELVELEIIPAMASLVGRLQATPSHETLRLLLASIIADQPKPLTADEQASALAPFLWLLEHAKHGITLTKAGYLKPVDVLSLSELLPMMTNWIGMRNREDLNPPVGDFRQMMTGIRLIRKYKGQLVLTRAGAVTQEHSDELWGRLGAALIDTTKPEKAHLDACVLVLIHLAAGQWPDLDAAGRMLYDAGWAYPDGTPPTGRMVGDAADNVYTIVNNLAPGRDKFPRDPDVPLVVRRFAWDTLVRVLPPSEQTSRRTIMAEMARNNQESGMLGLTVMPYQAQPKTPELEVEIREFEDADADSVIDTILADEDYAFAATGYLPGPGDLQSMFYALPVGFSQNAKVVLSIILNGHVVGVIDAVVGYPTRGDATIGTALIHPSVRRKHVMSQALQAGRDYAAIRGIDTIRVVCPRGWAAGEGFLNASGFIRSPGVQAMMNRVIHEHETEHPCDVWSIRA